ncbi:uncharacterized protein RJT21DRAFT_9295 [Scheffersomyces amazonensis]|uniref:uncharacterized protein n=1 Tax=Scheffersomyces amazonensis TaxID=1078765 RepID=UPI00315D8C10
MSSRRSQKYQSRHVDREPEEEVQQDITNQLPFTTTNTLEPSQIIKLYEHSFRSVLESPDLLDHVQTVKGDLFNRDYITAFSDEDRRLAYVARWTPYRSLCYASLFSSLEPIVELFKNNDNTSNVLCVGGGAASEYVALVSVFSRLRNSSNSGILSAQIIDIADWSSIINSIEKYVKSYWIHNPDKLLTDFVHDDILKLNNSRINFESLDLITLLFTTNELFAEKRPETIKFLQHLNSNCKSGSLLLIAESAGSFSNITIGTKKFPVQFLVDMVLVGKPGEDNGAWEIIEESESCWYRINPKEVDYALKLENMRFFFRLYRKK